MLMRFFDGRFCIVRQRSSSQAPAHNRWLRGGAASLSPLTQFVFSRCFGTSLAMPSSSPTAGGRIEINSANRDGALLIHISDTESASIRLNKRAFSTRLSRGKRQRLRQFGGLRPWPCASLKTWSSYMVAPSACKAMRSGHGATLHNRVTMRRASGN